MSQGHHKTLYPSHFEPQKCKRCKDKPAAVYVMAQRLSRSDNLKSFTSGPYCDLCADAVISAAQKREANKK